MSTDIVVVAETRSTNDDLRRLADDGWPEGRWLRATRQTGGRGRLGRAWLDAPGNLFASTLVVLGPGDPPVTDLSFVAGVAVHEALSALLPDAPIRLKWPNDVLAGGTNAKLAGILLERVTWGVIIGIGINVAGAPDLPDRDVAALVDLPGGAAMDAALVMTALAARFAAWLPRWRAGGLAVVQAPWLAAAHRPGERLDVHLPDGETVRGSFAGLGPRGELIVGLDDGGSRAIHAGDVGLIRGC